MKIKIIADTPSFESDGCRFSAQKAGVILELPFKESMMLIRQWFAEPIEEDAPPQMPFIGEKAGLSGDKVPFMDEKTRAALEEFERQEIHGEVIRQSKRIVGANIYLPILRTIINDIKTDIAATKCDENGEPAGQYEAGALDKLRWVLQRLEQAASAIENDEFRRRK